ncbi:MAG: rRNA pseudouridine synthase [Candidatus Omnitrophica bacterium]|nr:rRNA pseudouridine synthase [Candidatus Omnitrophota bacterium]
MPKERLQKILSRYGISSRRKAEDLIRQGRVAVNGRVVDTLGLRADPQQDSITVNGKKITARRKRYFAFYKPAGVISTLSDPRGRKTVADFFAGEKERLFPVGRLDYNSEGLLLVTNDGDWAHAVLHPSNEVPKVYHVKVRGKPEKERLARLLKGVYLADGKATAQKIGLLRYTKEHVWLSVTLIEGRKRIVRRMFEAIHHPVLKLVRVRIGPFTIHGLAKGEYRQIDNPEAIARREKHAVG